jgi:HK97 family phage major capsid protein
MTDDVQRRLIGKGAQHRRVVEAQTRAIDEDARTVELAFSSDAPIERGYGIEILEHGADSAQLDRLNSAAPLLVQHDHADQVGVVESARIDSDGFGRALVRFGRSARAVEIFHDVIDGIRQLVSVGYLIHEETVEHGTPPTFRATSWEPLEISLVAVPADAGVGVGRALEFDASEHDTHQEFTQMDIDSALNERDDTTPLDEGGIDDTRADDAQPEAPPAPSRDALDGRIRDMCRKYGKPEIAERAIELGCSMDESQAMLRHAVIGTPPVPVPSAPPMTQRIEGGRPRYSRKSLRAFGGDEERAYRMGHWARAHLFSDEQSIRWCKDHHIRVMTTSVLASGGALVPEEMSQAIIDLREDYGLARRLLRVVPMNSDTLEVPRRTSGVTAYFVGQVDAITESDQGWDSVSLTARKLAALTRLSTDLAEDAVIDVGAMLASEMAYAFAEKEDDCMFNGDGTSTYGGIQGFRPKIIDGTHTAGALDATSGTNTFAEIDADDLHSIMAVLPVYAQAGASFVVSQPGNAIVFDKLKQAGGGNTIMTIEGRPQPAYLGYPINVNQKMPTSTGDLENVAMILFGDFAQAATMGDRRGFTMRVLVERYAEYDQIGVVGTERFDINVHDLGDNTTAGPVVALIGA